ncbi:hypothetical protein F5B21DRAFT_502919 [Xylaria acuta]|nr:hypothetical protein F5B21DRAFT_502919 [Xylaria acuta]
MDNVSSTITELLRSGEYSDFTLVCEGQEFPVHKSIICPQSPVIAAALKSQFKVLADVSVAKTNRIEVNFEPAILRCMLDYLYTANYDEQPAQAVKFLKPAKSAQSVQPASTNARDPRAIAGGTPVPRPTAMTSSETLIYHARVNSIADYYSAGQRKPFAISSRRLRARQETRIFDRFIVDIASSKVFELVDKDMFSEGKVANDIAAEVLKASIKIFNSRVSVIKELIAELQARKDEIDGLRQNLDELADVLSAARMCQKRECRQFFGCSIQRPSHNSEKRWMARCAKCGGRYAYDKKNDRAVLAPPSSTN